MSVTEYVCNATLCGFDLLRVGSESYVPPGVHRHVCLLLHQWESEGMMRETDRGAESVWLTQTKAQTDSENVCVSTAKFFFVVSSAQFSIGGRIFKTSAKNEDVTACHHFLLLCRLRQHVQLKWFVCLSANIVTMQVFSHRCAGYLCCFQPTTHWYHTHCAVILSVV